MVGYIFNPSIWETEAGICELLASLVYRVSYRIAKATCLRKERERNKNNQKKNKQKQIKVHKER